MWGWSLGCCGVCRCRVRRPPLDVDRAQLREQLDVAMAGEVITPQPPDSPIVPLQQAVGGVDDRSTLLAMLGPQAVAADPALILRLSRSSSLPALAESRRRLLGLRLDLDGEGFAQGQWPSESWRSAARGSAVAGAFSTGPAGRGASGSAGAGRIALPRQGRSRAAAASGGGVVAGCFRRGVSGRWRRRRGWRRTCWRARCCKLGCRCGW